MLPVRQAGCHFRERLFTSNVNRVQLGEGSRRRYDAPVHRSEPVFSNQRRTWRSSPGRNRVATNKAHGTHTALQDTGARTLEVYFGSQVLNTHTVTCKVSITSPSVSYMKQHRAAWIPHRYSYYSLWQFIHPGPLGSANPAPSSTSFLSSPGALDITHAAVAPTNPLIRCAHPPRTPPALL